MRNKGCAGAGLPSFKLTAPKLFHSATILDGRHGLIRMYSPRARERLAGSEAPNISPSYSVMYSPSNVPKPMRPSLERNRAQCTSKHRLEQGRHFRRVSCDFDSALLHDGEFLVRRALPAGNDRTRVAHALPGRRGDAGDKSDHGLFHVHLDPARAGLLVVTADFTHHDLGVRCRNLIQHPHAADMFQAVDRVAADADAGRLPQPKIHELSHRFIGESAGTRDHSDAPLLVDVPGDRKSTRLNF